MTDKMISRSRRNNIIEHDLSIVFVQIRLRFQSKTYSNFCRVKKLELLSSNTSDSTLHFFYSTY